jgi:hypothetical protein
MMIWMNGMNQRGEMRNQQIRQAKAHQDRQSKQCHDQPEVRPFRPLAAILGSFDSVHEQLDAGQSLSRRLYSSRPGRAISSRIASFGLLPRCRIASICSVIGISTS